MGNEQITQIYCSPGCKNCGIMMACSLLQAMQSLSVGHMEEVRMGVLITRGPFGNTFYELAANPMSRF